MANSGSRKLSFALNDRLLQAGLQFGTPLYVYDCDEILRRCRRLQVLFGRHFAASYAVKANPNIEILRRLEPDVQTLDVSSFREFERACLAGYDPRRVTFSGPAKRDQEIVGAIRGGVGELVVESVAEAEVANRAAEEHAVRQIVLIRINPAERPRRFGVSFSGRASQFGIDEEDMDAAIDRISAMKHLDLAGFHIYSGTNSLDAAAIINNFAIFAGIFQRATERLGRGPRKLIFGAGFGLPYAASDEELDIEAVAAGVLPLIDDLKADARFAGAACVLELGRWIVGPAGWLLTRAVGEKHSRGTDFRMFDAGFNNALATCGMMGTVIRRNWRFHNVSNSEGEVAKQTLVGPLCTSIDVLASDIEMPAVRRGDIVAVENLGAYGLTASPTRFISHPEPAEVVLSGNEMIDATESRANHWSSPGREAVATASAIDA